MIKVSEIMSLNPHTVLVDSNLHDASQLMKLKQIHHLPVLNIEGDIVGLVSERDLLSVQESSLSKLSTHQRECSDKEIKIVDIMSRNVITVSSGAGIREAAIYLQRQRIACLPVVDNNKLIGIVTDSDYIEVAINLLEQISEME